MSYRKCVIGIFLLIVVLGSAAGAYAQKDYDLFERPFFKLNDDLKRIGVSELQNIRKVDFEPGNYRLDDDFTLGYGDTLDVSLWGKIEATHQLAVDRDGSIIIPLIGKISVIGLTLDGARQSIQKEIDKRYSNVRFDCNLATVEDIRVSILGEVKNPGAYSISPFARVVEAFAKSGGPSTEGSVAGIRLIRNGKQISDFNTYDYLYKADQSRNLRLKNDDTIFVPRMQKVVAVRGDVARPGIYEITNHCNVAGILDTTGGVMSGQGKSKVYILRMNSEKRINETVGEFVFDDISDIELEDNIVLEDEDTVIVTTETGYAPFAMDIFKQVTISGQVNMPGAYLVKDSDTLNSLLIRAGGTKQSAFLEGTVFTRESVKQEHKSIIEPLVNMYQKRILEDEIELADTVLTDAEKVAKQRSIDKRKKILEILSLNASKGRIIIDIDNIQKGKSDITLEEGDSIHIPAIPDWVLVTGSVYNPSAVFFVEDKAFEYYLNKVGGEMDLDGENDIYILKTNGTAKSKNTGYSRIGRGDIIVVKKK